MLSSNHIRLLKNIAKGKEIREKKPNKDLDYLFNEGCIEITFCDKPDDYFILPYLTEKGKARLFEERKHNTEKWFPIIISLIALVKSFLPELTCLMQSIAQLLK